MTKLNADRLAPSSTRPTSAAAARGRLDGYGIAVDARGQRLRRPGDRLDRTSRPPPARSTRPQRRRTTPSSPSSTRRARPSSTRPTSAGASHRLAATASPSTPRAAPTSPAGPLGGLPDHAGAFDTTYNGGTTTPSSPSSTPTGSALVYSTFLGGSGCRQRQRRSPSTARATPTSPGTPLLDFPTTPGAFDTTSTAAATPLSPSSVPARARRRRSRSRPRPTPTPSAPSTA